MFGLSKLYIWLIGAAATAAAALAVLLYIGVLRHDLADARVRAQVSADVATIKTEQTAATKDAAVIADKGAQRDAITITLHEDHANALAAASGASARLDPDLNAVGRRGLCGYAAYADDPSCAGLRVADPGQLPQAGGGNPPAGH